MYATNAFALKKVIRQILVENLLNDFFTTLNISDLDGFEDWAQAVQRQVDRLSDTQRRLSVQLQDRENLLRQR